MMAFVPKESSETGIEPATFSLGSTLCCFLSAAY
jgi:hypothetical protein